MAETRDSGPANPVVLNRIVPSAFHAPEMVKDVLANACGGPPAMSMRFNLPVAKNPIERLSADQNGKLAPSVPAIG